MRHACRAGAWVTTALLLSTAFAGLSATASQALDSTGGTPATAAESTQSGSIAAAAPNTAGAGGAVAPVTQGTGGSEYGVLAPKPTAAHKPAPSKTASHKPASAVHHSHSAPKPKPKPKPTSRKPTSRKPAKPAPTAPTAPIQGVPTPAQTVAEGAVFPVIGAHNFGNAENRFGAGRVGHIHEGQDVLASEGQEVVAPLAGTIITTAYQAGGAGWYAAEHTLDGLDFFYAHCQAESLAVSTGQAVSAGQAICKVGQTGDATGPHLHFEVWVGGWQAAAGHPIDPLPYLEAWDQPVGG